MVGTVNATEGTAQGLVHIYYGDGKGKTTAAVGLAVRCRGTGREVLFAQFLKGLPSGELEILEAAGIEVLRDETSLKYIWDMDEDELAECREIQEELMQAAWSKAREGKVDLLVLDEVLHALHNELLDEQAFFESLAARPDKLEVVLTGRGLNEALEEAADYITEMVKVKHPYDRGVLEREGIEY